LIIHQGEAGFGTVVCNDWPISTTSPHHRGGLRAVSSVTGPCCAALAHCS